MVRHLFETALIRRNMVFMTKYKPFPEICNVSTSIQNTLVQFQLLLSWNNSPAFFFFKKFQEISMKRSGKLYIIRWVFKGAVFQGKLQDFKLLTMEQIISLTFRFNSPCHYSKLQIQKESNVWYVKQTKPFK